MVKSRRTWSNLRSGEFSFHLAGLKRSFRLSKKDRMSRELQAKWKKCEDDDDDNQISSYREVVPYVRGPGEPNHLVLLVGTYSTRCNCGATEHLTL